jgi:hypothetical protein
MNREEMIEVLKSNTTPFGLLSKEMQDFAKNIPFESLLCYASGNNWIEKSEWYIVSYLTYRLKESYEDKSQEPEYEERPVTLASEFYTCVGVDLACVLGRRNFAGYRYADGMVSAYPVRQKASSEWGKPLDIEHPVRVIFRKDKA